MTERAHLEAVLLNEHLVMSTRLAILHLDCPASCRACRLQPPFVVIIADDGPRDDQLTSAQPIERLRDGESGAGGDGGEGGDKSGSKSGGVV